MDIRKFFHSKQQINSNPPKEASPPQKRRRVNDNCGIMESADTQKNADVSQIPQKNCSLSHPLVCTQGQFDRWKSKWSWLCVKYNEDMTDKNTNGVGVCCSVCSTVGSLKTTALTTERIEVEQKWITGIQAKNSKKLHDKISKHQTSKAHQLCVAQINLQKENKIKQ